VPSDVTDHKVAVQRGLGRPGTVCRFVDWDFAAPASREWDLAVTTFAWIPLHAHHVVEVEGSPTSATELVGSGSSSPSTAGPVIWPPCTRLCNYEYLASADGSTGTARGGDPEPSRVWCTLGLRVDGRLFAAGLCIGVYFGLDRGDDGRGGEWAGRYCTNGPSQH
jgi:hypothetical protein